LGRLLERADKISRIADVQYYLLLPKSEVVGGSLDIVRWSALLRSNSALEMYRRVHGAITPQNVAQFLILNRDFPRSIRYCLIGSQQSIGEITGNRPGTFHLRTEQLIGRLSSEFDYMRIEEIVQQGMHEFIDDFQLRINSVGSAIHEDFFTMPVRVEQ
jgi:uncharacterized alpha-E superfamily protein